MRSISARAVPSLPKTMSCRVLVTRSTKTITGDTYHFLKRESLRLRHNEVHERGASVRQNTKYDVCAVGDALKHVGSDLADAMSAVSNNAVATDQCSTYMKLFLIKSVSKMFRENAQLMRTYIQLLDAAIDTPYVRVERAIHSQIEHTRSKFDRPTPDFGDQDPCTANKSVLNPLSCRATKRHTKGPMSTQSE